MCTCIYIYIYICTERERERDTDARLFRLRGREGSATAVVSRCCERSVRARMANPHGQESA